MLKLSAFLTGAYFTVISSVRAEEDIYTHGEVAHEIEEGIESAVHASKGGLPQFEPEWFASQIFWLGVCFALLYVIFAKKTLPTISGVIENRKNHIQSNLDAAEKLTTEADSVHDAYQNGLTQAQNNAADALHQAEHGIKTNIADALNAFKSRSNQELLAAEGRIEASKSAAMGEMNAIAAEAASIAVEKIIGKTDENKLLAIVENMNNTKAKAA